MARGRKRAGKWHYGVKATSRQERGKKVVTYGGRESSE
jgi:hypothetical protein